MTGTDSVQLAMAVLDWVAQALIWGTVLAGLTWAVTKVVGKRMSPALLAGLWALVLVKFVLPIGPEWSLSLPTLIDRAVAGSRASFGGPGSIEQPVEGVAPLADAATADAPARDDPWWPVPLTATYLAVVALLSMQRVARNRRFIHHCRRLPRADHNAEEVVTAVCRRLGIHRFPTVRLSEELPAPLITGVLSPVLVLSRRQLSRPDELETVVVHEITHLRRGDMALRCLQWAAAALFFFWPVVAWINRRIDAAREHACDQWALRHGKLSPGAYARCLLRVASSVGTSPMFRWSTCMAGSAAFLERRIDMILSNTGRPASSPAVRVVAIAFFLAWSAFALTGATTVQAVTTIEIPLTDQAIETHAKEIVARIAQYPSADVDGNGEISFDERNAFLVTVLYSDPQRNLDCFPYSGPFKGEKLTLMDAYDVVRGLSYRSETENKVKAKIAAARMQGLDDATLQKLKQESTEEILSATEVVLDGQDALLDRVFQEPSPEKVATAYDKIDAKQRAEKAIKLDAYAKDLKLKITALEDAGKTDEADELRSKLVELEKKAKQAAMQGE